MRFRASQHLRRSVDFRAVREQGRRLDAGAFILWALARPVPETETPGVSRVGLVASTAAVGGAVRRNRARRRLREVFRRHQELVPAGYDLMIVARGVVNRLTWPELEKKFAEVCRKLPPLATPHA